MKADHAWQAQGGGTSGLKGHLAFTGLALLALMTLYSLLRLALLAYNSAQIGATPAGDIAEAFFNGVRFDLRLVVYALLPLLLALLSIRAMQARRAMRIWLGLFASLTLFLGLIELDFYREFNQRLNGLVFQYMKEDPKTVMSMLWYGFPVVRYLLAWVAGSWVMVWVFRRMDRATRFDATAPAGLVTRMGVLMLAAVLAVVAARGTLRQGAPLRWGDAFTTDSMFANQLGLNGTLSLVEAARNQMSSHRDNVWKSRMPHDEALDVVRRMLLTADDVLVDADVAAVRRDYTPAATGTLPIKNVVVILMESLAGHAVGALGATGGITPNFDRLAEEGVLFTRFFSNGTHTHQGMFASIGCFPNLPGFEYLMQTPEGSHGFSGLPQLLGARQFDNLYVYNGDFAWDNQYGFFGRQGIRNFVGRNDYINPIVSDPTWGVSDQDMFDRAAVELAKKGAARKPFYAVLQTLSNHTPYPLPAQLPVERVSGRGSLDQHLTAMRYADWALGRFFDKVREEPYYKKTLFVIVGDHGFPNDEQLTEMHLARFNVPLLLIAPGIREKFGDRRDTVGSQVDVVPTIMGRLGGPVRHQCWGRDLLNLPAGDPGFAVVKPSGGEQIVAIFNGDNLLVKSKTTEPKLYQYQLGAAWAANTVEDAAHSDDLVRRLEAYIETATRSLLDNTTGVAAARKPGP